MDLVDQEYWDHSYQNFQFFVAKDEVTDWLNNWRGVLGHTGDLFEFGCFPGRYMAYLGKQGWNVSGMDLTPAIADRRLKEWLLSENISLGDVWQGDVIDYAVTTSDQFDMVCSFGFIEHFENYLELIDLHGRLLKNGGHLVISTPNFRGAVQHFLHRALDNQNLKRHHLPAMQPKKWADKLNESGYEIIFAGYFGGFDFWCDSQPRSTLQKLAVKAVIKTKPFLKNLPSASLYTPYCGLIARKK